jgi:hypothetical protein
VHVHRILCSTSQQTSFELTKLDGLTVRSNDSLSLAFGFTVPIVHSINATVLEVLDVHASVDGEQLLNRAKLGGDVENTLCVGKLNHACNDKRFSRNSVRLVTVGKQRGARGIARTAWCISR